MKLFSNLKGDFIGGVTAGLITLPKNMALGALVFSPLGPEFIPMGVVAGVMSGAISNIGAAFKGGLPFMNIAPFSLSTFMLLSALEIILSTLETIDGASKETAVTLLFFTVLLSGLFQFLIGLLRLGSLAKFIPYPVLSGMINGTAVLIIVTQIKPFFGIAKETPWSEIISNLNIIQPFTLLVGVVVCFAIWGGPKLSKKIPSPLYGIGAGVIIYYGLSLFGMGDSLGPVIGKIPGAIPWPRYAVPFFSIMSDAQYWPLIGQLSTLALGIAGINALRALVVCSSGENIAQQRYNSNRELVYEGFGNMICSLFGGLSSTGSLSSTISNYQYGGRTLFSRIMSGVFPLTVLLLLYPLVAKLPNVVLAGMLIMIAISTVDKWTLGQISRIASTVRQRDFTALINVAQTVGVVAVLLTLGIFPALGAGVGIAILWFVLRMGKSVIRSDLTIAEVRSNTIRLDEENIALNNAENRIHYLELEGSLFFGTADQISSYVEDLFKDEIDFVIFEFTRVSEIDSTGAKLIVQTMQKYQKKGCEVYLSGLRTRAKEFEHRELLGLLSDDDKKKFVYPDLNVALAVAEDRLLDRILNNGSRYNTEMNLSQLECLSFLEKEQTVKLSSYLEPITHKSGETVFKKGEPGDSVYFITQGRARIFLKLDPNEHLRLATLCTGNCFGEMALIDGKPRSADIVAVGTLICQRLSLEQLGNLRRDHPDIGFVLLQGLAKELSSRLRFYNHKMSLTR
jgi:SulP family sulfate permease